MISSQLSVKRPTFDQIEDNPAAAVIVAINQLRADHSCSDVKIKFEIIVLVDVAKGLNESSLTIAGIDSGTQDEKMIGIETLLQGAKLDPRADSFQCVTKWRPSAGIVPKCLRTFGCWSMPTCA